MINRRIKFEKIQGFKGEGQMGKKKARTFQLRRENVTGFIGEY